ncbi:MAG: hypothetical protein WC992_01225 [Acholeplasmataceae bacterium]|nr:hypothetical protein [Acholeplasmataceae bacterium]
MFNFLIALFYYTFYIGISGIGVLFLARLYIGFKLKLSIPDLLMVLFIPGSIGLGLKVKTNYPLENIYFYLNVLFACMMFIGSIFILYLHLELNII